MSWMVEIAALAVAIAALRRSGAGGALARRVAALEAQVEALRAALLQTPPRVGAEEESTAAPPIEAAEGARPPEETGTVLPPPAAVPPPADVQPPRAASDVNPWRPREHAGPAPVAAPASPGAPALRVDWEQWLGVRGAAVLGGALLALAGIFFFRYSIEHGLLPPWLRVVLGTLAGVTCLAASERYLRRDYAGTANSLVGGGVVILYASFWAAHGLYALIGAPLSFLLMALVTLTCAAFSWRQDSLVIALIGLVGGFLTPLLLSSGSDRPIALFAYVLLLDFGLLYLARQRRWSVLPLISFAATSFYLAAWIALRMGPHRVFLGLALVSVFSAVFVLAPRPDEDENNHWWLSRIGGALLPFGFGVYFALNAQLGTHLYPVVFSVLPLAVAACWLSEAQRRWELGLAAAAASLGVIAVWLATRRIDTGLAFEVALLVVAVAATFHLFVERDRARVGGEGPASAGIVAAGVGFTLLIGAAVHSDQVTVWPWVLGWSGLTLLLLRHGALPGRSYLQSAAALALALALASTQLHESVAFPGPHTYLALILGFACALQFAALRPSALHAPVAGDRAATYFAVAACLSLLGLAVRSQAPEIPALLAAVGLGILAALAATRSAVAVWFAAAMLVTAMVQSVWVEVRVRHLHGAVGTAAFAVELGGALFFTVWPVLAAPRLRADRVTWYGAAFALPAWFWVLRRTFVLVFGDAFIGILPLSLGAVSLGMAMRVRALLAADHPRRADAFAWFVVVALGFVGVAIPLQLSKEWITLGWALEGVAAVWLWGKYDLPALKYFGLALLAAATVRLVGNPAVLGYYPRPRFRIVNWLAYTYLIPAACLLWAASILSRFELERVRARERGLYAKGSAVGAVATALAGLVVIFLWLNLAIADWFATGARLTLSFTRLPARDLATSVVWAIYALGLLAAGVRLASSGLRWASLGLLSITLAKVFLYDVGELRDLYRVASLLGLALSLIAVSLVYQRFVFRAAEKR